MDTFNKVKNTVFEAAREAKDQVVEIADLAIDKIKGLGREDVGILKLLKDDHDLVDGLFTQIEANQDSPQLCQDLFAQLKYEIEAHSTIEERVFYSGLKRANAKLIDHALGEHVAVKRLLADLSKIGAPVGGNWMTQFKQLKDCVNGHVKEEESEVFSLARKTWNDEQLVKLGAEFEKGKQELIVDRTPDSQRTPLVNAEPGTDRVRGRQGSKAPLRPSHRKRIENRTGLGSPRHPH